MEKINFQSFTKLPIQELVKPDRFHNEIVVSTPHKGMVVIPLIEGWLFKTEKDGGNVLGEIARLDAEAKDFLLESWVKNNPPKSK